MYLKDKWGKDSRMINEDFERVHFKLHIYISNCNLCLKKKQRMCKCKLPIDSKPMNSM